MKIFKTSAQHLVKSGAQEEYSTSCRRVDYKQRPERMHNRNFKQGPQQQLKRKFHIFPDFSKPQVPLFPNPNSDN